MPTKTEEYLRILAEGGDAPTGCCMTNEQKLIAEAIDRINNLQPSDSGGKYVLTLYADLSTSSTIELSSEDDPSTNAVVYGITVDGLADYVTHAPGSVYLDDKILSSYNLVVIATDVNADVDTQTNSVASVFARDSGETDPETGDPIQEYGILFTVYDSTDETFKEYEGVLSEAGGVWSITISPASFGYDNADNMEF